MKMISTNIHGLIDYITGILLIAIPWTYPSRYPDNALLIPAIIGIITIVYSVFTRYERGLVKIIPMRMHLILDALGALLLASSPWLFGFKQEIYVPHVLVGILLLIIIAFSSYKPFIEKKITESYNRN